jgi:RND family efflux transporter MFP subunit
MHRHDVVSVISVLLLGPALTGCGDGGRQQGVAPAPPTVIVTKPVERNIVDTDEYSGRFAAIDVVEVRARNSGYLDSIDFVDGQIVKQGDLLFTIDKRPFQTAVDQAKANLESARANLAFAELGLATTVEQVRNKKVTEQVFDERTRTKRVAEASVRAQEAAVAQALLELEFTELRAPVAGRIGDRRLSLGNLVTGGSGGNSTLLASIVSLDPIRFEFSFDEAAYLRYERLAEGARDVTSRDGSVVVGLRLIDEQEFGHTGRMDFVDNIIDPSSRTIRARAVFSNPNGLFTPGLSATIRVPAAPSYQALLLSDAAISTEQARKYVLVVDSDNIARQRYVIVGGLIGNFRIVKHGVAPDDRVILGGSIFARPGAKVAPTEEMPK